MAYDPDAVYNQTAADVLLQEGWEEGGLNEQLGNLKANTNYQEGEVARAEPGAYRGATNAANKGGILTSGVNAHRKEGIAAGFVARRVANQSALTQGEGRINKEREGGVLKRNERLHNAAQTRAEAKDRIARENPIVAPEPAAPAPPAPAAPAPPNTQGWVHTDLGSYRVGGPQPDANGWVHTPYGSYRVGGRRK